MDFISGVDFIQLLLAEMGFQSDFPVLSLAGGGALHHVLPQKMAEVHQVPQTSRAVHVGPDEALPLRAIGRTVVAVVVESFLTPTRLPVVHVGGGSGHHPPPVRRLLWRRGVDVLPRRVPPGGRVAASMLSSLGGKNQVTLAVYVRGEHDLPRVFYPYHPPTSHTSMQILGAEINYGAVGTGRPHRSEEGLALIPVTVREPHGPLLLQGGLLRRGQQPRVHLTFRPTIGHHKVAVWLGATAIAAACSRYAHHRAAVALPQHALLFVTLAAGGAASGALGVSVPVTHDPADRQTREDGACGEGGDCGHHQQVYGHQAVRLVHESLLEEHPCTETINRVISQAPTPS